MGMGWQLLPSTLRGVVLVAVLLLLTLHRPILPVTHILAVVGCRLTMALVLISQERK